MKLPIEPAIGSFSRMHGNKNHPPHKRRVIDRTLIIFSAQPMRDL